MKNLLGSFSEKIEQGKLQHGNELGMRVLGDGVWPETPGGRKTIALGQSNNNHAFFRPYLAKALDKGEGGSHCDGSDCWSMDWLKAQAVSFFASRTQIDSSDIKWWVNKLLLKIHLNVDVAEDKAKEFLITWRR